MKRGRSETGVTISAVATRLSFEFRSAILLVIDLLGCPFAPLRALPGFGGSAGIGAVRLEPRRLFALSDGLVGVGAADDVLALPCDAVASDRHVVGRLDVPA